MLEKLRFPARTAGFVGITFGMYGLLEIDTAASQRSDRESVLQKWIERYGKALLRLYGVRVVARGPHVEHGARYPGTSPSGKGRMFIMNHRSGLDVPITLAFVEATILSRSDLASWPVIGVAARRVGTLFVDRTDRSSGTAVISTMTEALERGKGIMVYPEGTTYEGDEVRPFRAGAFKAAAQAGAEIVPVGLAYEGEAMTFGDESFAKHMVRVSMAKSVRAAIEVGEPIAPSAKDVNDLIAESHQAMQALVYKARASLRGSSPEGAAG
ncbi:MAG TPA: lysophospholipid acyltransferase family protein [Polyangiaceae bacterium]|jgi:1-acyl-sn-glycerol-3-phosphate acyltransferase|nr:lysophospholipid acyltransferase family protein [Polyangiaceae bacterium]